MVGNIECQADQLVEDISMGFHSSITEYKVKNLEQFKNESKFLR